MARLRSHTLTLLIILSAVSLKSQVIDGATSVYFLDSPTHRFLRSPSTDTISQTGSLLPIEVGSTVSVLLGFPPPSTLSDSSSLKLNDMLMPNPFDRPQAVFVLEVTGIEDSRDVFDSVSDAFSGTLKSRIAANGDRVDIQLPGKDEVSFYSLDDFLTTDSDAEVSDKTLTELASWLGDSYGKDALKQFKGRLIGPSESDAYLKLDLSKKGDRKFVTSLVALTRNIQRTIEAHQDFSRGVHNLAELIIGKFDGIKALQEYYGSEGIAQQGAEVFVATVSKIFDSLHAAYKGQIVGMIIYNDMPRLTSESLLDVTFTHQPSARWLEETKDMPNSTTIAEVVLVRRTIAWVTGIMLVIATLLGVYFLLNMPLTKDTLLYSNVKLD